MRLLEVVRLRVKSLFSAQALDADLDEEVRYHLERQTEELIKEGLSPSEARSRARRIFGPQLAVQEDCRQARGLRLWDELNQDLRYGIRSLVAAPGLTLAIVLTIALGIGANSAVFSVIYSVILRPLPYPEPDRLVWITQYFPRFDSTLVTGNDFLDWQTEGESFESLAAWSAGPRAVRIGDTVESLQGVSISPAYFQALGEKPLAGRLLSTDEHQPGGPPAALIGERLWRERFIAQGSAVGRSIKIEREPHVIVGVIPQRGEDIEKGDLWVPLRLTRAQAGEPINLVRVLGRLRSGLGIESAKTELELIAHRTQERAFGAPSDSTTEIIALHEKLVGNVRRSLFLLWGAAGLLLLLVCTNVANLLLSRMAGRANEVSLKLSLGAGRFRLVRQLLTESLILSLAGAAAGLMLASGGMPLLLGLLPDLPRAETISIDSATLLFTATAALATAVVFGTLPALQPAGVNLSSVLKSSSRTFAGSRAAKWLQDSLVVSQFALATAIAFIAGLLIHSFMNMRAVDAGFNPEGLVTAEVQLSRSEFSESSRQRGFFRQALEQARAIPGVSNASVTTGLPYSQLDGSMALFSVEGRPAWTADEAPGQRVRIHYIDRGYFETLGVPMLAGRPLEPQDEASVVVSASFASRVFGGGSVVGRRLKLGVPESPDPWLTVAGVVADVRQGAVELDDAPLIYRHYAAAPNLASAALVVRSSREPSSLAVDLRKVVPTVDAAQPSGPSLTMQQRVEQASSSERERALLMGMFAALAALIAGSGIFGVLSHLVARRRPELGVRMALGAGARDVFWVVLGRGLAMAALGTACGFAAVLPLTGALEGMLFEIQPFDSVVALATAVALIGVALLACYLPARKAAKLDPADILRWE